VRFRILVVDEEPTIIRVFREALEPQAWEVFEAADAAAGLEQLQRSKPDVIVSDILIRGMDGLAFLQRVREIAPDVPVLLTSAYTEKEKLIRALQVGAFDFIDKPFSVRETVVAVQRAMRHRLLLQDRRRNEKYTGFIEHLARTVNASHTLEDLFERIRLSLGTALSVRLFSVFLYDATRQRLILACSNHVPLPAGQELLLDSMQGPMADAIAQQSAVIVPDFERSSYARRKPEPEPRRAQYVHGASATIPLMVRGKLVGVLNLNDKLSPPAEIDAVDVSFFKIAAEHLASAITVRQETLQVTRTLTELQRAQADLVRVEKLAAVSRLVAGVAHEIKNPLTSLHFAAINLGDELGRYASAGADVARGKKFIATIVDDVGRIRDRVDKFMMFSGRTQIDRTPCAPDAIAAKALEQVAGRCEAVGISIKLTCEQPIPPVSAEPEMFLQAVINLLVNAIEAIDKDGAIEVTVRSGGGRVQIEVKDSGPGIAVDIAPHVFNLFFTTKEEGSGFGLSQVHVFCDTHGGRISILPTPRGACFLMDLPVS
jgi:signal transduction histidine kinase/CheY-like chemotaxis protein